MEDLVRSKGDFSDVTISYFQTRLREAEAENAVLKAALKPFADIPSCFFDTKREREVPHYWVIVGSPIKTHFTRDHLRIAREALNRVTQEEPQ